MVKKKKKKKTVHIPNWISITKNALLSAIITDETNQRFNNISKKYKILHRRF